jgi:ribose transport system ATP-binding protein
MDGNRYEGLTPTQAKELGIAVIYQEFTLVPVLSAAENIFLGDYLMKGPVLDRRAMVARANELFARLKVNIDPRTLVQDLTTGYQQIVEIAKALARNARILVMDEPSAPLTMTEVEAMFEVVETLREQGVTVIYISHRMEEIFHLGDRVSILRDGQYVATRDVADTNRAELITLMVGRELSETFPERTHAIGEPTIRVSNLTGNGVRDISFEAHRGEVLGFAGLVGAGRTELMEMLFGAAPSDSGTIDVNDRPARTRSVISAIGTGIALVPEDRKRHGVLLNLPIKENVSLPSLKRLSRFGVVDRRREAKLVHDYRTSLRIKTPSVAQKVGNLSGGNQQKVVLSKWLFAEPEILLLDEPTRGIDVGAKFEIYTIINRLADEGKGVVVISSELPEILGICDRIYVVSQGKIAGELDAAEASQEAIMKCIMNVEEVVEA